LLSVVDMRLDLATEFREERVQPVADSLMWTRPVGPPVGLALKKKK